MNFKLLDTKGVVLSGVWLQWLTRRCSQLTRTVTGWFRW